MAMRNEEVLLTGATGYVGGRLLAALERDGRRVRCLVRRPEALVGRVGEGTGIVKGDCLAPETLPAALDGIGTAYYLVHSLGAAAGFEELDRAAARNFAAAARHAGVRRIVYLGGLGEPGGTLSAHLRSRQETGDLLRAGGVPVVELRSSIIIGSGSLSYELMRGLVERLPVMICPRWVNLPTQPIAIEDVIAYLVAALGLPPDESGVFEIGGPDVTTYSGIMGEYARQRGLRRRMLAVPLLTPRLSSLWLGLVTPVQARVGRRLVESLRNPTVMRSDRAQRTFAVRPRTLREAVARALSLEDAELAATRWSDALSNSAPPSSPWGGRHVGSRIVDSRSALVEAAPSRAFAPVRRIGGASGWYAGNLLWRLRGWLDQSLGGVGLRRGRRDPQALRVGESLDFWRVEAYEPDRLLRLAAEMKVPGRAWLQFEARPATLGRTELRQTAIFDPWGLAGLAYWYALYPVHAWIFRSMLREIAARACEPRGADEAPSPGLSSPAAAPGSPPASP
jgi:uncharacterized protein YbjT (DUF2867 family)